MLDNQKNQEVLQCANYWLNQSKLEEFEQKIGLQLLNHANTKVGAVPANFFFCL